MVTGQQNLSARLSADTSGFNNAIAGSLGLLNSFKGTLIAIGTATAAGNFLSEAISEAVEFESAMVEVEKVTNEFTAGVIASDIEEMAAATGTATNKLADMAAQAGRFGVEGSEKIRDFVDTTNDMVIATDLAADEAGRSFAKISTALDLPKSKIRDLGDAINGLSNNFAVSSSEITQTVLRSGTTLRQDLGLTTDQVLGLSAAFNEVSPTSRRAAQMLRILGESLMDPKQIEAMAKSMNMTSQEFTKLRDQAPLETIKLLSERLNSGGESAQFMREELTRRTLRSLRRLDAVFGNVGEAVNEANKQLGEAGDSLNEEVKDALDTSARRAKQAAQAWNNFERTIGSFFQEISENINLFGRLEAGAKGLEKAIEGEEHIFKDLVGEGVAELLEKELNQLEEFSSTTASIMDQAFGTGFLSEQEIQEIRGQIKGILEFTPEDADLRKTIGKALAVTLARSLDKGLSGEKIKKRLVKAASEYGPEIKRAFRKNTREGMEEGGKKGAKQIKNEINKNMQSAAEESAKTFLKTFADAKSFTELGDLAASEIGKKIDKNFNPKIAEKLREQFAQTGAMDKIMSGGELSFEEFKGLPGDIQEAIVEMSEFKKETDRTNHALKRFIKDAEVTKQVLQGPLENTIFQTMTGEIKSAEEALASLGQGIARQMARLTSRQVASNITGIGTEGPGLLGSALNSLPLGGFFSGGSSTPTPSTVGASNFNVTPVGDTPQVMEASKGALTKFKEGDKVAAAQDVKDLRKQVGQVGGQAQGTGQVNVETNINVSPDTDQSVKAQMQQILPQVENRVKASVLDALQSGGGATKAVRRAT